jgi:hypothetical protein
MPAKPSKPRVTVEILCAFGAGHASAEEGVACKGTAAECTTYKINKKAFLFVRPKAAMVKLGASIPEAAKLEAAAPELYRVGIGGWVTITLNGAESPDAKVLERWIAESYALYASSAAPKPSRPKAAKATPATARKKRASTR